MPTPGENDVLKFIDIAKQLRVPFVIYADFETYVKPIQSCDLDPNSSHTSNISEFKPCGFAYHIVSTDKRYTKPPGGHRRDVHGSITRRRGKNSQFVTYYRTYANQR